MLMSSIVIKPVQQHDSSDILTKEERGLSLILSVFTF